MGFYRDTEAVQSSCFDCNGPTQHLCRRCEHPYCQDHGLSECVRCSEPELICQECVPDAQCSACDADFYCTSCHLPAQVTCNNCPTSFCLEHDTLQHHLCPSCATSASIRPEAIRLMLFIVAIVGALIAAAILLSQVGDTNSRLL